MRVAVVIAIATALFAASAAAQAQCSTHTTCLGCTGVTGCGWKANLGVCESGGVFPDSGSNSFWDYSPSMCGTASGSGPTTCATQSSCMNCIEAGCGWNSFLSTCQLSTAGGTSVYTTSCPCNVNSNCVDCTLDGGCGWDGSTCRPGTLSGPTSGSASTWSYATCFNVSPAAADALGALLILIIIAPIIIVLCIIGCCVYCCCFRQRTVVMQQPVIVSECVTPYGVQTNVY